MTTIESGQIVKVTERVAGYGGKAKVYYGRFLRETSERWEVVNDVISHRPRKDNVIIQTTTAEGACEERQEGERVAIRKYGSQYIGTVESVGRTNVKVRFKTVGGKQKVATVKAIEVEAWEERG